MGCRKGQHRLCLGPCQSPRSSAHLVPCLLDADPSGAHTNTQGSHRIETSLEWFGDTCGILPVGEPAHVTTRGLKWDLGPESCTSAPLKALAVFLPHQKPDVGHNVSRFAIVIRRRRRADFYPTSVAHCVSSSNHLPQETVEVDTDTAIVWTVEVRQPEEVEHEGGGDAEQ